MNPSATITIIGNAVEDPELRFTPSGAAVATFRIASTPRHLDKTSNTWVDGETTFLTVTQWRGPAENLAETVKRGTRLVVMGRLQQRSYETKEGEKRTVFEVQADEVAVSLTHATATVTKAARSAPATATTGEDPWATNTGAGDEPPF